MCIELKCTIVGKRKVSYVDKKTGELKEFAELFYTYAAKSTNTVTVDGIVSDKVFIPVCDYEDIPVDCQAVLDFDNRGNFCGVELL